MEQGWPIRASHACTLLTGSSTPIRLVTLSQSHQTHQSLWAHKSSSQEKRNCTTPFAFVFCAPCEIIQDPTDKQAETTRVPVLSACWPKRKKFGWTFSAKTERSQRQSDISKLRDETGYTWGLSDMFSLLVWTFCLCFLCCTSDHFVPQILQLWHASLNIGNWFESESALLVQLRPSDSLGKPESEVSRADGLFSVAQTNSECCVITGKQHLRSNENKRNFVGLVSKTCTKIKTRMCRTLLHPHLFLSGERCSAVHLRWQHCLLGWNKPIWLASQNTQNGMKHAEGQKECKSEKRNCVQGERKLKKKKEKIFFWWSCLKLHKLLRKLFFGGGHTDTCMYGRIAIAQPIWVYTWQCSTINCLSWRLSGKRIQEWSAFEGLTLIGSFSATI